MKWIMVLAGLLSGVIAGMGMGGGTLLIPVLTLLLCVPQRGAQGVNMLAFLPAAVVALYIHYKSGRIDLKSSLSIILGGIVGAVLGALAATILDSTLLKKGFGLFLAGLGVLQLKSSRKSTDFEKK